MARSLLDILREDLSFDDRVAFVHRRKLRRRIWTYGEVARASFRFSRELRSRNIGRGDRVVIWAENCPEWVVAFYGAILNGVIVVPLDEQSSADFASLVCEKTRPKLILAGANAGHALSAFPTLAIEGLAETITMHSASPIAAQNISVSDTIEIVFTSGTTSEPKGVELTHDNILATIEPIEEEINKYRKWQFAADPFKIVSVLPLSHVFGQVMGIFVPYMLGAQVVFHDRLNPAEIIETIRRERAAVLAAVPRILETLQNKIERDISLEGKLKDFQVSLEAPRSWLARLWKFRSIHRMFGLKFLSFVTGGASLNAATEEFWSRLGFLVVQGYGMTETSALVSINNPFSTRRGSVGQILAGQDVKIGEDGEILVRGRNVSSGYWAAERLDDSDGWLHTGDIGSVDETGRLYFKGRKKNVIVTAAGLNIYPEDLEAALNRQPEIIEAVVVGIVSGNETEPVAVLILRPGSDGRSAVSSANEILALYQHIRLWFEWPEPDFPRTATQKIRKGSVAEFAGKKLADGGNELPDHVSPLDEVIAGIGLRKTDGVGPGDRLSEDLALDSLSRVELMSAIEDRFQIEMNESSFTESTTIGEIEEMIRSREVSPNKFPQFSYPRWPLRFPVTWLRSMFFHLVISPIIRVLCRVKTVGIEDLDEMEGPLVFASNHITRGDPVLIMAALPHRFRRRLAIAMDGEMLEGFRHPYTDTTVISRFRMFLQYWLVVSVFNAFPLPNLSGFRESFSFAGTAVDRGFNILIFPEGRLTKDGRLQDFRSGTGLLADGLNAAVVPVRIKGLYELKVEGRRYYAPPGSITVAFGRPMECKANESAAEFTARLKERITSLMEKASDLT